jgi:hypothetical protein
MTVVGEAWVQVRVTDAGLELKLVKDVEKAALAAEKKALIPVRADTTKATGPLDVLRAKMQSFAGRNPVTAALGDITTATGGASSALTGFATGGIAIAGAALTAFALKGVSDFTALASQVRAYVRVTGETPEVASRMVSAFRAVGADVEGATTALGRFSRNLTTNTAALQAQGVQIAQNRDGTVNITETFLNLADQIHNSTDAAQRNTLVMTAFGRAGLSLLPILSKGREGIQELFAEADKRHALLTQEDLDAAKQFQFNVRQLKEEFAGLERIAGKAILPLLTDLAHGATVTLEWIDKIGGLISKITTLGGLTDKLGVDTGGLSGFIKRFLTMGAAMGHTTKASKDTAAALDKQRVAETDAAAAADLITQAETEHAKVLGDIRTAVLDYTGAQRSLTAANRGVADIESRITDDRERVASARARLNELLAKGAVDTDRVAAASRDLAAAERDQVSAAQRVEDAGRGVADSYKRLGEAAATRAEAEAKLNDLLSGRVALEEMARHAHDLEHATIGVAQAKLAEADAQARLNEVLHPTVGGADEIAVAADEQRIALYDLNRIKNSGVATTADIARSTLRYVDATKKLRDLQDPQPATEAEIAKARLDVQSATLAVVEAEENQRSVEEELIRIQAIGTEGSAELAAARDTLSTATDTETAATQALAAAQRGERDAVYELGAATADLKARHDELNAASAGEPDFAARVAEARRAVRDATRELAGSERDLNDARVGAAEKAADLAVKQQAYNGQVAAGLPALKETRGSLEALIRLQPQAISFLQPSLDVLNQLITQAGRAAGAALVDLNFGPFGTVGIGRYQAGGYASGDFWAGEHGRELIRLAPGGRAMVYPAGQAPGVAGVSIHAPISIEASFGAGTNANDVMAAMRRVAEGAVTDALTRVVGRVRAGTGRVA